MRTTNHKFTGWVDMIFDIVIETALRISYILLLPLESGY